MDDGLIAIGFWWSRESPRFPHPQDLVGDGYSPHEREQIARYLDQGVRIAAYLGYAHCRFRCGIDDSELGCHDLTDGAWLWPQGLSHYVREHGVMLPSPFIDTMRSHAWKLPSVDASALKLGDGEMHRKVSLDLWLGLHGRHVEEPESIQDQMARIARRFRDKA